MKNYSLTLIVLMVVSLRKSSSQDCFLCLAVGDEEQPWCPPARGDGNNTVVMRLGDLQSALMMIARLDEVRGCVRVGLAAGRHVITAPVDFGNASVEFVGAEGSSGPPTIYCNYTVDVDPDRIFDPGYFYVDYTMSFSGSEYVSFDGVEFVGCPYPLRLERVRTVAIHNNTFQ